MKRMHGIRPAVVFIALACFFETQAATYNLTVMANHQTHAWNRFYEQGVATDHMNGAIHTVWGLGWGSTMKVAHNDAGFTYFRGHAILDADIGLVVAATATTLTLNWTRFDSVYDMAEAGGMRPSLEISCTPPALASGTDTVNVNYNGVPPNKSRPTKYGWGQWVALMDSIVTHCEARWGVSEVRKWYFEVWNEPDWWYINFSPSYVTLYDYTAYGLKLADSLIKVGGPACEGTNTFMAGKDLTTLLNHCHTGYDSATKKTGAPLDFLTHHWYSTATTGGVYTINNSIVLYEKMIQDSLRKYYSWFTGPVICDEQGGVGSSDMLQSGTWLVNAVHQLNEVVSPYSPPLMFDHWAISDLYEEQISNVNNLAFGAGGNLYLRGDSTYPNSWSIGKPVMQVYKMMHRLGAFEDSSSGGAAGDGVNLIATSDSSNDSIQVLVYDNYQATSPSSAATDSVVLTVNNIPWAPGQVHVEQFLVDTTHGNTYSKWVSLGSPARPTNAQWDSIKAATNLAHYDSVSTQTLTGTSFTKALFPLHYYGVSLIVLSNPAYSAVRNPAGAAGSAASLALRAEIRSGRLILAVPAPGWYRAELSTTSGRKVFGSRFYCAGTTSLALQKIPAGIYLLQCSGPKGSVIKQIVVRP